MPSTKGTANRNFPGPSEDAIETRSFRSSINSPKRFISRPAFLFGWKCGLTLTRRQVWYTAEKITTSRKGQDRGNHLGIVKRRSAPFGEIRIGQHRRLFNHRRAFRRPHTQRNHIVPPEVHPAFGKEEILLRPDLPPPAEVVPVEVDEPVAFGFQVELPGSPDVRIRCGQIKF